MKVLQVLADGDEDDVLFRKLLDELPQRVRGELIAIEQVGDSEARREPPHDAPEALRDADQRNGAGVPEHVRDERSHGDLGERHVRLALNARQEGVAVLPLQLHEGCEAADGGATDRLAPVAFVERAPVCQAQELLLRLAANAGDEDGEDVAQRPQGRDVEVVDAQQVEDVLRIEHVGGLQQRPHLVLVHVHAELRLERLADARALALVFGRLELRDCRRKDCGGEALRLGVGARARAPLVPRAQSAVRVVPEDAGPACSESKRLSPFSSTGSVGWSRRCSPRAPVIAGSDRRPWARMTGSRS